MQSFKFCPIKILYVTATLFSFIMGISACSKKDKPSALHPNKNQSVTHPFAAPIEKAHKMKAWKTKGALKTDIAQKFGNHPTLNATLYVNTNGPGIRLEMSKDTVAVFDGEQMWVTPSDSAIGPFQLKVWAYFLKAPYKLDDPGTIINPNGAAQMKGQTYDTAKLTFKPGTGDSPNDWFILYRNPHTNRLKAMAYIITYGKTVKEANKNPHAITYQNFNTFDGIPIATSWKFWSWNTQKGFSDKPVGQAQLTNTHFVKTDQLFSKPAGAMKMKRSK